MTVAELTAFLATQPPNAIVLIAGPRHTHGDIRATAFAAFTQGGEPAPCFVTRQIIREDDTFPGCEKIVPVVVIGAP
jgi:hypothetical protein